MLDICLLGILLIEEQCSGASRYLMVLMVIWCIGSCIKGIIFVFIAMWAGSEGISKVPEILRNQQLLLPPRDEKLGKEQC